VRAQGIGSPCLAIKGDNRYHAILGAKKCFAVCPSDTAVDLAALDAMLVVASPGSERILGVPDFYHSMGNDLKGSEILKEIRIPKPKGAAKQIFTKFTLRKPIDFAVVSAAVVLTLDDHRCTDARIVLGAVAPPPWRVPAAEKLLVDRQLTRETAAAAARAAVADAKPLAQNGYKIEITKALLQEAILAVSGGKA
jgi:xanthine dehydrogenase YagS FAD-binding subunit